ncbi:MgtC/SapB family protein [Halobacteriaceae bacterium SHR40]|uniref:MgtC/SapB family protein n=1 Tax=Halovenus amylolytica TaxID=2500550 RepID=UPI000FE43083
MVDPATDPILQVVLRVAVAFGIGALIGLERERSDSAGLFAGSRTFPLFGLFGALVQAFFPAMFPVALVSIAVPLTVAYAGKIWKTGSFGLTTVTAALLTVILGALTVHSETGLVLAIIIGGVMTIILSAKSSIHAFVDRIEEDERRASIKFILIVFVIFPLLPDREIDALLGLNPRFIWLMVVFVTGLSFAAYILSRIVGTERGIALTGVVGGFISSTATSVSMAEQTSETPSLYQICGFSIVVASIVMFPRATVEVAAVNPELLPHVVVPLGAMTGTGILAAGVLYWWSTTKSTVDTDITNPFRLQPALLFGAIFAVVLLVSESAHTWVGPSGVYVTAFVSGLADVDAITLTLSKLAADDAISVDVATTGIIIGAISNTLVKAALVWILGTRELAKLVTVVLVAVSAVGLLFVFL